MTTPKDNLNNNKEDKQKRNNLPSQPKGNSMSNNNKIIAAVTLVVFLAVLTFTVYLYMEQNQQKVDIVSLNDEKSELSTKLVERDSLIDNMVNTFNEIETDLSSITQREASIEVSADDVELSKSKKDQVLKDIKYINALLESNKRKISYLSSQLKKSGLNMASLEEKLNNLEQSIMMRDSSIQILKSNLQQKEFELASLNEIVDTLEVKINEQGTLIDNQVKEMHTAYLTTGDYEELEMKGVLKKEGGFLGIGKDKTLQEDLSEKSFNQIDILETKTIPVHSKKAELITSHPAGSYAFVTDSAQAIAYLEIKDPYEFWKISKYAVVETKK